MYIQALVPHRDTILKLARLSKQIITDFNTVHLQEYAAFPRFPLWAFSQDFPDKVDGACILSPRFEGTEFYFPLQIRTGESDCIYRIVFASLVDKNLDEKGAKKMDPGFPTRILENFPIKMSCYKTGNVVEENNGFCLFDERWFKITI